MYTRNWLCPVSKTLIITCRKVPLQVNFLRWRHFAWWVLSFYGSSISLFFLSDSASKIDRFIIISHAGVVLGKKTCWAPCRMKIVTGIFLHFFITLFNTASSAATWENPKFDHRLSIHWIHCKDISFKIKLNLLLIWKEPFRIRPTERDLGCWNGNRTRAYRTESWRITTT